MWNASQKRTFAKEVLEVDFERGRAFKYLTSTMRIAIVEARILAIVRHQVAETVTVAAIDDLLHGVVAEVKRQTKNPQFFE
jgi:hypothetical protein